jgi:diguanylate cyclase (GGDEF)-like protein
MSNNERILIVDDTPLNIQMLADMLKDDYQIMVATSGRRCIELASGDRKPVLILLDIEMPDMNGYEVIKELKSISGVDSIPVIFVTALTTDGDEQLGLELGAVDYITKPLKAPIVRARVNTHMTIVRQRNLLIEQSIKDGLTGLFNRTYIIKRASDMLGQAERHQYEISVLILDVDHFKSVNDTHGHQTGDVVLVAIAKAFQASVRAEDVVGRYGGEEFIILLGHCDLASGVNKAQAVRETIEQLKPAGLDITVSVGISSLNGEKKNLDQLIAEADSALYQAKHEGRNRVVRFVPS